MVFEDGAVVGLVFVGVVVGVAELVGFGYGEVVGLGVGVIVGVGVGDGWEAEFKEKVMVPYV